MEISIEKLVTDLQGVFITKQFGAGWKQYIEKPVLLYVNKPFTSTIRFCAERIDGPNQIARKKFNIIFSAGLIQEIKLLEFYLYFYNSFELGMITSKEGQNSI